jgi:hypothetical protein
LRKEIIMGVLTEDMRRLRGQIDAAHGLRETLLRDLSRGTKELKRGVSAMLKAFGHSHQQRTRRQRADGAAFLAGVDKAVNRLRLSVAGLRHDFATDLQGAHEAWCSRAKGAERRKTGTRAKRH